MKKLKVLPRHRRIYSSHRFLEYNYSCYAINLQLLLGFVNGEWKEQLEEEELLPHVQSLQEGGMVGEKLYDVLLQITLDPKINCPPIIYKNVLIT